MRVLLTGGTGFVGINLVEKLLDHGHDVVIYAKTPFVSEAIQSFENRRGSYQFVAGDIHDVERLRSLFKECRFQSCIHGAVITPDVQREKKMASQIIDVNLMGTVHMLELAREFSLEKLIYMSSVSIYGAYAFEVDVLKEEERHAYPISLYEISKYAADQVCGRYRDLFDLPVIIARIGHVFGPWEHETGYRDTFSAPFQALRLALKGEKAVLPGAGVRDWIYSRDVAGALTGLLETNEWKNTVYQIGSGKKWSLVQWCERLAEEFPDFSYTLDSSEEGNIRLFLPADPAPMSIQRLVEERIYQPKYDMHAAFADYLGWVRQRESFFL
ncbi:NAD-dependent epimerase/dehydratase family protein [Ammoniphilus resinae]|uniref:Nucleoside-diphosphate-sugar epimerase n=1 Tax=Ammoniphilus resinae TaxID=861532 RepID=A0ABS4GPL9_9BACL|nr:NAD(P)-dependent oxidoreductase [Ammoniphilus resinae]MBP1932196.1 nucleoside-diphosphate-sugar epimerase [Ammoniphilus resinae]